MARLTAALDRDARIIGLVCFPHITSHFHHATPPPMFGAPMVAFALDELEVAAVVTTCIAVRARDGGT
jgi:hypothetical protein